MAGKPTDLGPNPLVGPQSGPGLSSSGSVSQISNVLQAQHRMFTFATASSAAIPFLSANRPGNLLVCVVRAASGVRAECSASDSAGNIWKEAVRGDGVADSTRAYIFYALNAVGGANTVTVISNPAAISSLCIIEYHNGDQFNGPDFTASTANSVKTVLSCGNLQPGFTNEIWVEVVQSGANNQGIKPGVGWNVVDDAIHPDPASPAFSVGNAARWLIQDRLTTSIQPYNTEFSVLTATSARTLLAAFRTSSSAPANLGNSIGEGPGRFGNPKFAFPSISSGDPPGIVKPLPQVLGAVGVVHKYGPVGPDISRTFVRDLRDSTPAPTLIQGSGAISTSVAAGSLAGTGAISGTSVASVEASGALTGAAAIAGTSVATIVAAGSLAGSGALGGTSVVTTDATGNLGGTIAASGVSVETTVASGALAGTGALSGTSVETTYAAGSLLAQAAISGTSVITTYAAGDLRGSAAISGSSITTTYSGGILLDAGGGTTQITGTSVFTTAATGAMTGAAAISGISEASFIAAGSMQGTATMAGVAITTTALGGNLRQAGTTVMRAWVGEGPPNISSGMQVSIFSN